MFVKQVYSDGSRHAVQLESVISISVSSTGGGLTLHLVDGSTSTLGYETNAEARAAFDELLELLGWMSKPEGSS